MLKTGRTHLQDAVPITLGQEFGGYAANVAHAADGARRTRRGAARAESRRDRGRHRPQRRRRLHARGDREPRRRCTALPLRAGAQSLPRDAEHGRRARPTPARCAGSRSKSDKVASDLRLLSMGPRAGIAEIQLPAVQPGSSIMPGKVNPSVPEMVNQVCYQVCGCDATILAAADAGQLELNVMMPVIAWNALHATTHPRAGDARAARPLRRRHRAPTRRAAANCSTAAPRSRPRSARTSATPPPPTSPRRRSRPGARSAISSASAGCCPDDQLDAILSPEAMTSPGVPGQRTTHDAMTSRRADSSRWRWRSSAASRRSAGGAAHAAVSAEGPRAARGPGPRRVAAAGPDHGRAADRRGQRRR